MSRYQILHEGRNGRNKVGIFDNQEPAKYDGKEIVRRSMTMEETRDRLNALEAERDRYKAALEYIESTPTTWTLGVDENMERLRTIATQALGGGDE